MHHQALELLERDGYEAVVTDIEMPGELDGLDLAWTIEAKWPQIGVVVTSGKCLPVSKDLLLTARFVAKPIPVDVLLQAVEDVIED